MKGLILGTLFALGGLVAFGAEQDSDQEIYYILQKGFIKVAGTTNLFDFKGQAVRHEGQLVEKDGSYTGKLLLRFVDLNFDLPGVGEVLERADYMNDKVYPTIFFDLDHFTPAKKPTEIKAELAMHGATRPITIATQFEYLPPVVKVTGSFSIKQTDFNVKPYRAGLMKVGDILDVQFKVFFCEYYTENANLKISAETAAKLATDDKISVLMEKGFFGCEEIKKNLPSGQK